MVIQDGKAMQTEVETGIREGDLVQITKGLNGSETVIVGGSYGLPDKTKVKVAEARRGGSLMRPSRLRAKTKPNARTTPILAAATCAFLRMTARSTGFRATGSPSSFWC